MLQATTLAAVSATAGCLGQFTGGESGENNIQRVPAEAPDSEVTIQWAVGTLEKKNEDFFQQAWTEAGLPDTINVELLADSRVTNKRQARYRSWLSGERTSPTLLMMDAGWTIPFIARGQIQNLGKTLPKDMLGKFNDDYFQASIDTASMNGDLYAAPMFVDFPTMLYRKDLVTEAGYDPSGWQTSPMSWQRFAEVTKDVQEQTGTKYGFTFQAQAYEGLSCCDFNEFMTSWGGAYFGDHGNLFGPVGDRPITVDDQAVVDAIKMIRTFVYGSGDQHSMDGMAGGFAPSGVLSWTEEPSRKPFANGNVVMHRNWPYAIGIHGKDPDNAEDPSVAFGEDLGVMPIPYGVNAGDAKYEGAGGSAAALGGWHMAMNPHVSREKKKAAVKLIEVMQSREFKLRAFEDIGWMPPEPGLLDTDQAKEVPIYGRYLDTLLQAGQNAVPRPVTEVWPKESSAISEHVNRTLAQQQGPADAMSSLKSQLNSIENKNAGLIGRRGRRLR